MYLATAKTDEELLNFGLEPCIEFLNLGEDSMENGNDDLTSLLLTEVKGKLFQIKSIMGNRNRLRLKR